MGVGVDQAGEDGEGTQVDDGVAGGCGRGGGGCYGRDFVAGDDDGFGVEELAGVDVEQVSGADERAGGGLSRNLSGGCRGEAQGDETEGQAQADGWAKAHAEPLSWWMQMECAKCSKGGAVWPQPYAPISEGDEVIVELIEGAGPALSHGFVHGVEGALLGVVGVKRCPLQGERGFAAVFDEGGGGEHFEGPVGDVGMAGYVAVLVGEGVDEDNALGRDDLHEYPFAPHFDAVGGAQAIVEGAVGDQVEMADGYGEAFGAEPELEVLLLGPGGEDELARGVEDAGDGELAVVLAAFWKEWGGGVSVAGGHGGFLV